MPEGLSPIEAGKKLHEHSEAAHEQAAAAYARETSASRHSRMVQIGEAVLLALVKITAVWASYSAAKWGTASRIDVAKSSMLRTSPPATTSRRSRFATSMPRPSTRGSPPGR